MLSCLVYFELVFMLTEFEQVFTGRMSHVTPTILSDIYAETDKSATIYIFLELDYYLLFIF